MAKCKYYYKNKGLSKCRKELLPFNCGDMDYCPEYQLKRKSRYKRIKAWATGKYDGQGWVCTSNIKLRGYTIPCTILIEAKYLRGEK